MDFKKHAIYLIPAIFLVFCIALALGVQATSDKPLEKKKLHQQITEIESYNSETLLLIDQYKRDKLTTTYFTEQLGQIQKQVLSTEDELQKSNVTGESEKGLRVLTDIVSEYAFISEDLQGSNGDRQELDKEQKKLLQMKDEIAKLSKTYE